MKIGIPVFGMPLRIYQKRGVYGRQFVLRNGRLDILGIDTAGDLYVIELKRTLAMMTLMHKRESISIGLRKMLQSKDSVYLA